MIRLRPDIAELAEFIAEENQVDGLILPEVIADKKDITYCFGNYKDSFVGLLEYADNTFHIYLNNSKLRQLPDPRTRFTFAHELGHYFIDEHRLCLLKGISLSFSSNWKEETNNPIETEANHFASHLLVPKFLALPIIQRSKPGMQTLLTLKEELKASIACCGSKMVDYVPYACASIFFTPDRKFKRASFSSEFENMFRGGVLRIEHLRLKQLFDDADSLPFSEIAEEICFVYNWFDNFRKRSLRDMPIYQQLIKQGEFGYLMIITPLNM